MRNMTESQLTAEVLKRYAATPDQRLRLILQSVIKYAHDFVRDVKLTEAEWAEAVRFLTATGQMCDDKRQEMILLSDNLGISALVNMISANVPEGATETTVLGPFYVPNSQQREPSQSILLRESNEIPLIIHGRVLDKDGDAIANASIEVWQTDSNGMYDIQDSEQPEGNLRGIYAANDAGEFAIRSIRPTSYPIPIDGPVGALLRATGRHPYRPAHMHAIVRAHGYQTLTTHLFDADDPYLDSDVVFAVKESLIRTFIRTTNAEQAARFGVSGEFWELENDFTLVDGV